MWLGLAPVVGPVSPGKTLNFIVRFEVVEHINDVRFTFVVHRATDQLIVYERSFTQQELGLELVTRGPLIIQFQFDAHLTRGQYYFDVFASHTPSQRYLGRLRPAGHLTVVENLTWGGVADLGVRASVTAGEADSLPAETVGGRHAASVR